MHVLFDVFYYCLSRMIESLFCSHDSAQDTVNTLTRPDKRSSAPSVPLVKVEEEEKEEEEQEEGTEYEVNPRSIIQRHVGAPLVQSILRD